MERSCAQHFVTQPSVCNFVLSYKDSTDQFHKTENETLEAGSRHSTVETAVCPRVPYACPCFDYSSLPSLEWGSHIYFCTLLQWREHSVRKPHEVGYRPAPHPATIAASAPLHDLLPTAYLAEGSTPVTSQSTVADPPQLSCELHGFGEASVRTDKHLSHRTGQENRQNAALQKQGPPKKYCCMLKLQQPSIIPSHHCSRPVSHVARTGSPCAPDPHPPTHRPQQSP